MEQLTDKARRQHSQPAYGKIKLHSRHASNFHKEVEEKVGGGRLTTTRVPAQAHLGVEVGRLRQTAIAAGGCRPAAAEGDALVFGFFEPICVFPVGIVVNAAAVQLGENREGPFAMAPVCLLSWTG